MAIPSFWLGMVLLLLFRGENTHIPLFGSGILPPTIFARPFLGFGRAAVILRLARASMVEELSKEYVITARAKGLTENMVKYKARP